MGLRDIFRGMLNGPRGRRQPSTSGSSGRGGMSPIMMALLGLLAYKALKGSGGQAAPPSGGTWNANNPGRGLEDILGGVMGGGRPNAAPTPPAPNGSLADMIRGGLGSVLGPAAGGVLSGGLGNLVNDFQHSGLGQAAQSWIGLGPNQKITPRDLEKVLGSDALDALSQRTGLGRQELLAALAQHLPELIDQLTPKGRLPTTEEAARMV